MFGLMGVEMPWDEIKRMSEDSGGESPQVILARIDERVKNLNDKFLIFYVDFQEHKKEDAKNFNGLYKLVWAGGGIFAFITFVITIVKK